MTNAELVTAIAELLLQTGKDVQAAYAMYLEYETTDFNRAEIALETYKRLGEEYRHLLAQYDAKVAA